MTNTQHTSTKTNELSGRKPRTQRYAAGLGIVIFLSSAVLSLMLSGGMAQADSLPPRPATPMPLEPTSGPVDWSIDATAEPLLSAEKVNESTAYIELSLPANLSANAQTVVQWQDKQGSWHNVDGWQQDVAASNPVVRWSVYPRDFGTGPFRWAVYSVGGKGGRLLAASASFNLPCCYGNTLRMDAEMVK